MFKRYFQKQFINFLVKHLYNTIKIEDVVQTQVSNKTGNIIKVFLGGRALNQAERNEVSQDARHFASSTIWKLIKNSVYYNCDREIKTRSKTDNDALGGKIGIWILEVIDKSLEQLKKL